MGPLFGTTYIGKKIAAIEHSRTESVFYYAIKSLSTFYT
jgi:hypothetical protein